MKKKVHEKQTNIVFSIKLLSVRLLPFLHQYLKPKPGVIESFDPTHFWQRVGGARTVQTRIFPRCGSAHAAPSHSYFIKVKECIMVPNRMHNHLREQAQQTGRSF